MTYDLDNEFGDFYACDKCGDAPMDVCPHCEDDTPTTQPEATTRAEQRPDRGIRQELIYWHSKYTREEVDYCEDRTALVCYWSAEAYREHCADGSIKPDDSILHAIKTDPSVMWVYKQEGETDDCYSCGDDEDLVNAIDEAIAFEYQMNPYLGKPDLKAD